METQQPVKLTASYIKKALKEADDAVVIAYIDNENSIGHFSTVEKLQLLTQRFHLLLGAVANILTLLSQQEQAADATKQG